MVTWGANSTTTFGTATPAAAATAPAAATGFAFGGTAPSTPPAASTPAPSNLNPPPLGGFGAPAAGGLFGSNPGEIFYFAGYRLQAKNAFGFVCII